MNTDALKTATAKLSTDVLLESMVTLDAQIAAAPADKSAERLVLSVIFDELEVRTPGLTEILDEWIDADDPREYAAMVIDALDQLAEAH